MEMSFIGENDALCKTLLPCSQITKIAKPMLPIKKTKMATFPKPAFFLRHPL